MTAAKTATVDKDRQAALSQLDEAYQKLFDVIEDFSSEAARTTARKEIAAHKAKIDAAKAKDGAAATRALKDLVKTTKALHEAVYQRAIADISTARRKGATAEINANMMALLLQLDKIDDGALGKLMLAEQAKLRERADKTERNANDTMAMREIETLDLTALPAFDKRVKSALALDKWLKTTYQPMLTLVKTTIKAAPSDAMRKVLLAEVDMVESAKNEALAALDPKAVQTATVPLLRRASNVATRASTNGSAIDRELVRVGALLKDGGSPVDLMGWLKKLVTERNAGWPQARTIEDLETTMDAFEKDLAELAQTAKRAAARKAPTAAR